MLNIGTLVLYKDDDEPCLGIVTGESRPLADFDEEDLEDFYAPEELKAEVYPVRWFDMQSICCEQEENLIVMSEAK
tara:strand:- start:1922 stop:2149 length:228 start_codon:yes stop_codon:yes gene_type:complete